jgi:transcriptional regulator with XRE-family HTH domain
MDIFAGSDEDRKLLEQERAIVEITELICSIMEETGVTRSELAKRMQKHKSFVTQFLNGTRNMTIRTVSDALFCLGRELKVDSSRLRRDFGDSWQSISFTVPLERIIGRRERSEVSWDAPEYGTSSRHVNRDLKAAG